MTNYLNKLIHSPALHSRIHSFLSFFIFFYLFYLSLRISLDFYIPFLFLGNSVTPPSSIFFCSLLILAIFLPCCFLQPTCSMFLGSLLSFCFFLPYFLSVSVSLPSFMFLSPLLPFLFLSPFLPFCFRLPVFFISFNLPSSLFFDSFLPLFLPFRPKFLF